MEKNEKKELYQHDDVLVYIDWEKRIISVEKGASYMVGKPIPKTEAPENIILKCLEPSDL